MATSHVQVVALPNGDISKAVAGAHVILEAGPGCYLHSLNLGNNQLVVYRKGRVSQTTISKALPSVKIVNYPPPHTLISEEQKSQAINRALQFCGKEAFELRQWLASVGASSEGLSDSNLAETFCSYCVTGLPKRWNVMELYHASPVLPKPIATSLATDPFRQQVTETWSAGQVQETVGQVPAQHKPVDRHNHFDSSHVQACVAEGATKRILQGGMHGPAARFAGAAAAVGCEAYRLYGEVQEKSQQLKDKVINQDQFTEGVTMCSVSASGRAMGGLAGAGVGQAMIPIPIVGAVVGGVAGAVVGGVHSETFASGVWRLSGNKAKAADNVKCIEHKVDDQPCIRAEYTNHGPSEDLACSVVPGSLKEQHFDRQLFHSQAALCEDEGLL